MPTGIALEYGSPNFMMFEAAGLKAVHGMMRARLNACFDINLHAMNDCVIGVGLAIVAGINFPVRVLLKLAN